MATEYYQAQRRAGEAYERFVLSCLVALGHDVTRHDTAAAQFAHGDLRVDGRDVEIKYDARLAETGNLYIEVAEKTDPQGVTWFPSGIARDTSARWYGIGDRRDWFLFRTRTLRETWAAERILTIDRGTSRGFLLSRARAAELAVKIWRWPATPLELSDVETALRAIGTKCFGITYTTEGDIE
jgi:hypothetical protein